MAVSFSDQIGMEMVGHLEECAEYLHARGLDYKECNVVTALTRDPGFFIKTPDGPAPYPLTGWGFRIKDRFGEPIDGAFLMRPCNWPDVPLYHYKTTDGERELVLMDKRTKFRQMGTWNINWVSTAAECKASSTVMIHEKFSCAYLSVKHLGVPSIGLSGCHNWRKAGAMLPELRDVILNMPPESTIYMCLDGDVLNNPGIQHSASSFKGYLESMRPDMTVVFPVVPEGYGGWDDWAVDQEDIPTQWLIELNAQHVDITGFLPPDLLVQHYGLAYKLDRDDNMVILHTSSNYLKLFNGHPKWADYVLNIDDMLYDKNYPGTPLEPRDLARRFEVWLTECVFRGVQAEKVSSDKTIRAVEEALTMQDRRFSLPHYHIEAMGPAPSTDEAREAARRMVTDGIKVVGPMTEDETVETMMRVFRDMVGMWSYDFQWAPQWMLALIGPTNAGKSDFPRSALRALSARGFVLAVNKLHHTGDKAKPEEMARVLKSALVGVVDEYNPPARTAKVYEDQLISVCSDRILGIRKMRENNPKPHLRNASVFLTTTDKNRQYLRSGKGEGAERRAITLELVPHYPYEGKLSSNRKVISECGEILLRWGLWAYRNDYPGSATEFSVKHAAQYLEEDDTLRNVGKMWTKADLGGSLEKMGEMLHRAGTKDWRLSPSQLYEIIYPGERLQREQSQRLQNLAVECGATKEGKGRVNHLSMPGKEIYVDTFIRVGDWPAWCQALRAALGA